MDPGGDDGGYPLVRSGGLELEVKGGHDFGYVEARLGPNVPVLVEGGAMSFMSDGIEVRTRFMGGFLASMIRKMFGGESLFVGEYSHPQGGVLGISPAVPGKVIHYPLQGETLMLQGGAFLACTPGIDVNAQFGGLRALFGGEGLFFLRCSGNGELFFNAYGDVIEHDVSEPFVVDTGHVVGWETSLDWKVRGMGGIKSTLFSGEGLVLEFTGRGKLWTQTRSQGGFVGWLKGFMR